MISASSAGALLRNIRSVPRLAEAFRKIWMRVREPADRAQVRARLDRYAAAATDFDAWASQIAPDVFAEVDAFWKNQQRRVAEALSRIDLDLGGGGHGKLLYFLVRVLRPETVVETGVAAGHSSRAILCALRANGAGVLYSSDLPYLLVENADTYVGVVVEDNLRANWRLFTEGDRANLPRICGEVERVDLFHYDSDKSSLGREFALRVLEDKFSASTVVIFDDIQDNDHFDRLSARWADKAESLIFQFGSKSVGALLPRGTELGRAPQ